MNEIYTDFITNYKTLLITLLSSKNNFIDFWLSKTTKIVNL